MLLLRIGSNDLERIRKKEKGRYLDDLKCSPFFGTSSLKARFSKKVMLKLKITKEGSSSKAQILRAKIEI